MPEISTLDWSSLLGGGHLLYEDFVLTRDNKGRTVDMYAWVDKDEDIQEFMDDFQIIVDDLSKTKPRVDPTDWRDYQRWIWEEAK